MKAVSGACGPAIAQSRRTLMVEDVPSASWSEQGVTAFFEKLYGPACVYSCVCLGHDEPDLHPSARAAAHLIQVNTGPATAFVTLRSAERCAEAQQVVLSHTSGWQVREAPRATRFDMVECSEATWHDRTSSENRVGSHRGVRPLLVSACNFDSGLG